MKEKINYDTSYRNTRSIAGKLKEKPVTQLLPVPKSLVFGMKRPLYEDEIERTKEYNEKYAVR
jgi:hypothetical protein